MKRIIALVLLIVMLSAVPTFAQGIEEKAESLYSLGLLKGTSSKFSIEALELDRYATRAEICVTVVRMLGKEEKARYQKNGHPFKDVPSWASDYVGWLYENYLVNGVSETYFGASDAATIRQFATMLLRVLGYDDTAGDFAYSDAVNFAFEKGVISSNKGDGYLLRSQMIDMSYNAMGTCIKNSARRLIDKLCDEGVVNKEKAQSLGVMEERSLSDSFPDLEETLGEISVEENGGVFVISFENEVEHFGLRVFMREKGTGKMSEVSLSGGNVYMKKGQKKYYGGDPAGYVSELYVYGLDENKEYSFIVIKTTSESELYKTVGKSTACEN